MISYLVSEFINCFEVGAIVLPYACGVLFIPFPDLPLNQGVWLLQWAHPLQVRSQAIVQVLHRWFFIASEQHIAPSDAELEASSEALARAGAGWYAGAIAPSSPIDTGCLDLLDGHFPGGHTTDTGCRGLDTAARTPLGAVGGQCHLCFLSSGLKQVNQHRLRHQWGAECALCTFIQVQEEAQWLETPPMLTQSVTGLSTKSTQDIAPPPHNLKGFSSVHLCLRNTPWVVCLLCYFV